MAQNDFSAESPYNYEPKCFCILILDVSGSMSGAPIKELNDGLQQFQKEVLEDTVAANRLEVSIITFDNRIKCLQEPALINTFDMPTLSAGGTTKLVDATREGIAKAEARKLWYRDTGQAYYRPWIILMTDGVPDSDQDITGLASDMTLLSQEKKVVFLPIGVDGADMNMLNSIAQSEIPPLRLDGIKFKPFFLWLSNSMKAITASNEDKIDLQSPDDWTKGFQI